MPIRPGLLAVPRSISNARWKPVTIPLGAQTLKHISPYDRRMAEEVVEVFLPNDPRIEDFHVLSAEDKLKVVRLGLAFFAEGTKNLQKWNNSEWETTIKAVEERNKMERERLMEQIRANETQFTDYVHTSKVRQDALAKEIGDSERRRCRAEVEQLRSQNESLTAQIERHHVHMHKLSSEYDDRREKKLDEQRDYYESKMKGLEGKVEEMRKEKDAVIERFSQYTHNSSIRGRDGEEWVYGQLNMTFPKADIEDTHTQPGRGDFILREEGITMMVEAKNYSRNVQKAEIDKFYRDIDSPANSDIQCATFVSLKTGIAGKEDFELEVRNGIPVLFIHSLEDNFANLLLAWKFFRLMVAQDGLDLSDKEICDGFRNTSKALKRNFSKMRKNADKYHTDTLASIAEQETEVIKLYGLTKLKF